VPVFFGMAGVEYGLRILSKVKCGVAGIPKIVAKIFFDHLPFVAKAKNELLKAVMCVRLHDMPKDWPVADWQHWLGTELGFLAQTRSFPAAQDDHFHLRVGFRGHLLEVPPGTGYHVELHKGGRKLVKRVAASPS
jgi:hypothetical protein